MSKPIARCLVPGHCPLCSLTPHPVPQAVSAILPWASTSESRWAGVEMACGWGSMGLLSVTPARTPHKLPASFPSLSLSDSCPSAVLPS